MKRFHNAFTLVELLIVIAIIGILMAILLPSLGAARRAAGVTSCSSNMRQIVVAIANYAQDNKDRLYSPVSSLGTYTTNTCNSFNNLAGLAFPIKYLTTDVGYDPAMPHDFKIHGSGTSNISFYSVVPIVGATNSTAIGTCVRFSKFSQVPADKALVMDVLRLASNLNHAARVGPPTYNLAFRDGSVKSVTMPKEAFARFKAVGPSANQWHIHNDLIRAMELAADGKDPSRASTTTTPWPWAANSNTSTHYYIPRYGGPTKQGKAHALSDG